MIRSVDAILAALLFLNALMFAIGALARWTFEQWLIPDIVAIVVCGAIGLVRRIRLLVAVAAVIVVGMFLRLSIPLWLAIDVFIMGSCTYLGYLLLKGELHSAKRRARWRTP